jgi:hypothetical protein
MSPDPINVIQRVPEGRDLSAMRWCTYTQLRLAVIRAKAMNLNHQLPPQIVRRLDPQGINTFTFLLVHEHADLEPAPRHVRVHALIKLRGRKAAYEQELLDIPAECWRHWRTKGE